MDEQQKSAQQKTEAHHIRPRQEKKEPPNTSPNKARASGGNGEKLSQGTKYLMYGTAIFFDLLIALINIIPIAGQIIGLAISVLAYGIFFFWFSLKGVRMLTPKKLASMGLGFLFSWTPLPAITASVFFTIFFEKREELLAIGKVAKPV